VLDHRASGTEQWSEAGRTLTDAKGRAVFVSSIPVSTDFRTRALPDQQHAAASSATVTVQAAN
jgi:protocatechuate 3,4-dioxygenase beta subunit